jgi:hypothetical protein
MNYLTLARQPNVLARSERKALDLFLTWRCDAESLRGRPNHEVECCKEEPELLATIEGEDETRTSLSDRYSSTVVCVSNIYMFLFKLTTVCSG